MTARVTTSGSASRPLEAEYARLHRVLQVIQLIQQQDGWDAKALARACGVTERTIYRDLTLLQGANIPFFFDEDRRCYRIRQDFFMPPIDLALDEALALVALGLFLVLLKIGRPSRFMFVLRQPGRSWMTREAWIATGLFPLGAVAALLASPVLTAAALWVGSTRLIDNVSCPPPGPPADVTK